MKCRAMEDAKGPSLYVFEESFDVNIVRMETNWFVVLGWCLMDLA